MPIKTEVQVICETLAGMWKAETELANVSSRHVSGIRRDAAKIEKELSTYIRNFLAEWNSDTSSDMPTIIECVNSGGVNAGCDVFTACPDEDGRCENCAARYLKECKRAAEIHAQETAAFLTAPTMAGCLGLMGAR